MRRSAEYVSPCGPKSRSRSIAFSFCVRYFGAQAKKGVVPPADQQQVVYEAEGSIARRDGTHFAGASVTHSADMPARHRPERNVVLLGPRRFGNLCSGVAICSEECAMGKKRSRKNLGERVSKDDGVKPALLLFGNDVSAEDIVEAINAERKRQLETGDIGRRMVRMRKRT
jgi:hypothetical protein